MKEKEKAKEMDRNPVIEAADEALKNYGEAVRTGLKFQEETWQCWCSMLNQTVPNHDWQKYFANANAAGSGLLPGARRRMEEAMELVEKNTRQSADLMKKALDAAQTPALLESQTKWTEFWKDYLNLAKGNADAFMQMNRRAVDSWVSFVQKNAETAEAASKAA